MLHNICHHIWTYRAFLQFLTAGISLCRPSSDVLYSFMFSTSRTSSDICSKSAKAEQWISDSLFSDFFSDLRNSYEWSFISIRQWKMFMLLYGEILSLFISFRLLMTFWVVSGWVSVWFNSLPKILWLDSRKRPWRKLTNRSRWPFGLSRDFFMTLLRKSSKVFSPVD